MITYIPHASPLLHADLFGCLWANAKWESVSVMQIVFAGSLPNATAYMHFAFHWEALLESDFAQLTPEGMDFSPCATFPTLGSFRYPFDADCSHSLLLSSFMSITVAVLVFSVHLCVVICSYAVSRECAILCKSHIQILLVIHILSLASRPSLYCESRDSSRCFSFVFMRVFFLFFTSCRLCRSSSCFLIVWSICMKAVKVAFECVVWKVTAADHWYTNKAWHAGLCFSLTSKSGLCLFIRPRPAVIRIK